MINEANGYTVLRAGADSSSGGDPMALTDFELGLVLGGNASDVTGSATADNRAQSAGEANWDNSSDYRDGATQMVATVGGVFLTGVTLVTTAMAWPLAVAGALVAGTLGAFSAADAQMDMRSARPDEN